jgi:hypothetical protein
MYIGSYLGLAPDSGPDSLSTSTLTATITADGRKYLSQFFGLLLGNPSTTTIVGTSWNPIIKTFKVGEGGWIDPGSGRVRRNPVEDNLRRLDNNIQDLDAVVDTTRASIDRRYPADSRAVFEKTLITSDFIFEAPSSLRVRCFLDFSEFNTDGSGNFPEIWEIGLFSDHPVVSGQKLMIAYATFPKEIKNGSTPLENIVRLSFQ